MKISLLLLGLFIFTTTSLSAANVATKANEFPEEQMRTQNKTIARMFAEEISKTLPQKIDKYTDFVKITNNAATIIYTFEINTGSKSDKSVRDEDRTRMYKAVRNGICKTSMKFLKAGINISYIYISTRSKANLFQFDITQKDCK